MSTQTKSVPLDLNASDIKFTLFFSSMKIEFLAQKKQEIQIYINLTANGSLRMTPREIREMKRSSDVFQGLINQVNSQTKIYLN